MTEVTASIPALPSTSRSGPRRANAPPQLLAPVGLWGTVRAIAQGDLAVVTVWGGVNLIWVVNDASGKV